MGASPMTAITGIFGATQEARAAKEAMRILNEGRQLAFNEAAKYGAEADKFMNDYRAYYTADRAMLEKLYGQAQAIEVGDGISGADRIAFEDAQKMMNENLSSTGNLRSGAASFANAELTRRVVADAQERRFGREMNKLQLLFGAQGQAGQQTAGVGNMGLNVRQLQTNLFQAGLGMTSSLASAEIHKGSALSNQIVSYGKAADEIKDSIREGYYDMLAGMSTMGGSGGGGGGMGGMMGGGGGGGGMGMLAGMFSDARLKTDIQFFATVGGVNLYRYKWAASGVDDVGPLAQEVKLTHPDAVREVDGYLAVDYGLLGIDVVQAIATAKELT